MFTYYIIRLDNPKIELSLIRTLLIEKYNFNEQIHNSVF